MIRFNQTKPYAGPFPRGRHYHRCPNCFSHGGNGVNCYKSHCTLPRDLKVCAWCGPRVEFFPEESPAPARPAWPPAVSQSPVADPAPIARELPADPAPECDYCDSIFAMTGQRHCPIDHDAPAQLGLFGGGS